MEGRAESWIARGKIARGVRTLTFDPLPLQGEGKNGEPVMQRFPDWERGQKEPGFFAAAALNDNGGEGSGS